MKKHIIYGMTLLALITLTILNVQFSNSESHLSTVDVDQLITKANACEEHPNSGWTIMTQGATADEREEWIDCAGNGNFGLEQCLSYGPYGGCLNWSWSSGGPTKKMSCLYGHVNCTTTSC